MKIMFQMMNEARLAVGMQVCPAHPSLSHALQYTKERLQGCSHGVQNPRLRVFPHQHPDVRRSCCGLKSPLDSCGRSPYSPPTA
jgi:alkylation response protein AidB-like acyl-CoA dehydrogenase